MDIIDQLLADFRPTTDDPELREGLHRGQDIKAISKAEDQGLLEEIAPGSKHNSIGGITSGVVAAQEDWHESSAKPFTAEDSVMSDVLKQASDGEEQVPFDETACAKGHMASAAVHARISDMLHLGRTPRQVSASLDKLAELQSFDRSESDSFLKDQAGLMGYAYIEPNHFNQKSCVASLRHIQANGSLKAKSVKRIKACDGCGQCKSDHQGGCKCATYGLPIVSSAKDLEAVVTSLAPGKTAKKAALVAAHNGTPGGAALPGHTVHAIQAKSARDTTQTTAGGGSITRFNAQEARQACAKVSSADIQAKLDSGKTFGDIYTEVKSVLGSAKAETILRRWLDGLKHSEARIHTASVSCSLLRNRLTASETLIGTRKCATCTLRGGMHCGFTGGTILSFPGMTPTGRKRASSEAEDGVAIMDSMELRAPELVIDIKEDRKLLEVEMPTTTPLYIPE